MEADFWHKIWEDNNIAFHQTEGNKLFIKHLSALQLKAGDRLFLPLCGKTRDIANLLRAGYQVVGAELSQLAIEQLFKELGMEPKVTDLGRLQLWQAQKIDMFVGDIFDLDAMQLGSVAAVLDRAALVALPADLRRKYAVYVSVITEKAPQLLITFDYDQSAMDGPPFSVPEEEVRALYGETYQVFELETIDFPGLLKGKAKAMERAWLLSA